MDELVRLTQALADANRLRLLELLSRRALCVTAVARELGHACFETGKSTSMRAKRWMPMPDNSTSSKSN